MKFNSLAEVLSAMPPMTATNKASFITGATAMYNMLRRSILKPGLPKLALMAQLQEHHAELVALAKNLGAEAHARIAEAENREEAK